MRKHFAVLMVAGYALAFAAACNVGSNSTGGGGDTGAGGPDTGALSDAAPFSDGGPEDAGSVDAGRVPADPCDEYFGKYYDCIPFLCAGKSCAVCDSLMYDYAKYQKDGYGGTCAGATLSKAVAGLKGFSCDTNADVQATRDQVNHDCAAPVECRADGDACTGGSCARGADGTVACRQFCTVIGDTCADGACYFSGTASQFLCFPTGIKDVGEACGSLAECVAGAQCLTFEGATTCFAICTDTCAVGECTDTGLGFKVCIDLGGCASANQSCYSVNCCSGLYCDTYQICRPNAQCVSIGADCEVDSDCCAPADPSTGAWCNEEGKCAECAQKDGACTTDYDCCPGVTPLMCTGRNACRPICSRDLDCNAPEVCLANGECVPPACSADSDCGGGNRCCGGDCKADCGYGAPTACAITTPGGAIAMNKTLTLHAVAYRGDPKAGAQIIPWTTFAWTTSDATRVAVDAAMGTVTGMAGCGTATIGATAGGIDCGTVTFTNYLPETSGKVRVAVVDEKTGGPVQGAEVIIGANNAQTTDAMGLVEVTSAPGDVHVFHQSYSYVSVIGVAKNDFVIHLPPKPDDAKTGGYKGTFDFSGIKDRALQGGCASTSLSAGMVDESPNKLIYGDVILTHVKMETAKGGPTDYDDWMMLPAGLVLRAEQFGAPDLIPNYRVEGGPGLTTAWGLAGGLPSKDITKVIQILSPIIGGGDMPVGQITAALFPIIEKFSHAVRPVFDVVPIANVRTACIDKATGTVSGSFAPCLPPDVPLVDSDAMPDYSNFPTLDLKPTRPMLLKTVMTVPDLPKLKGKCLGEIFALGGVTVQGLGFVPTGMQAGLDNPDDPKTEGDCRVNAPRENPEGISDGQMLLRMAPSHDGTETSPYAIMLAAIDPNAESAGCSATTISVDDEAISAVFKRSDSVAPANNLAGSGFLAFPEGAFYDRTVRKIGGPAAAVAGAAFYRYGVSNDKGGWYVYTSSPGPAITLPAVPAGVDDRASGAGLSAAAVGLTAGATLDSLVSADGGRHLDGLMDVMSGFSRLRCLHRIAPSDPDYSAKCRPSDPTKVDPACNPACEVR